MLLFRIPGNILIPIQFSLAQNIRCIRYYFYWSFGISMLLGLSGLHTPFSTKPRFPHILDCELGLRQYVSLLVLRFVTILSRKL